MGQQGARLAFDFLQLLQVAHAFLAVHLLVYYLVADSDVLVHRLLYKTAYQHHSPITTSHASNNSDSPTNAATNTHSHFTSLLNTQFSRLFNTYTIQLQPLDTYAIQLHPLVYMP